MAIDQQTVSQLLTLFQRGEFDIVIKKALVLIKRHRKVSGLHDLAGAAFAQTGDTRRAELHLMEAVRLQPNLESAVYNLANLYFQTGRYDKATTQFQAFLKYRPNDLSAALRLGESYLKLARPKQAADCFQRIVDLDPKDTRALFMLGTAFRASKQDDAALHSFSKVVDLDAYHFDALFNLGNICRDLGKLQDALVHYERALACRPGHISTMCNIGLCHVHLREIDCGQTWFEKAIQSEPENPEARYMISLPRFLSGDFKAGFAAAEWRFQLPGQIRVMYAGPEPVWDGQTSLDNKRLIIHAEQGFGDSIMMLRFVSFFNPKRTRVTMLVQRGLKRLFEESFNDIEFIEFNDNQTGQLASKVRGDAQCSLMSLAHLTASYWSELPNSAGYLRSPTRDIEKWSKVIAADGSKRIGLVWRGSSSHVNDHNRSVDLCDMMKYLPPGPRYIALQKDVSDKEHIAIANESLLRIETPKLGDFADTAALCSNLDAVLSVDTSVAHLAGALGVPAIVALPYVPDWRWGLSGSKTVWYSSMTLCRQNDVNSRSLALKDATSKLVDE